MQQGKLDTKLKCSCASQITKITSTFIVSYLENVHFIFLSSDDDIFVLKNLYLEPSLKEQKSLSGTIIKRTKIFILYYIVLKEVYICLILITF